ncbi:hypothetical protein EB796_000050 [Bugula neritina]|uniref:Uncharacterized protein n=1 Tax=Bugula neritina TaxID=10212 RepID=A0A7J7KU30_BUGNE|nr:hypothetical protein EB796_000050 [Bugula neritina]
MELSTASVAHDLVTHVDDNGPRAFMLSPSIDYGDENDSSGVVTLPNIEEGSPYLIDIATDCLLTETMALSKQVNESLPSSAISLHSYSQVLPSVASECLHNYSQPIDLPLVGAKTEVLHNYSQPWPQNTDSFTSVHNYCINNDVTDQLKDLQPHNEVKIYKCSTTSTILYLRRVRLFYSSVRQTTPMKAMSSR